MIFGFSIYKPKYISVTCNILYSSGLLLFKYRHTLTPLTPTHRLRTPTPSSSSWTSVATSPRSRRPSAACTT